MDIPMATIPGPSKPRKGKSFKLLGILDVENIECAQDSICSLVCGVADLDIFR